MSTRCPGKPDFINLRHWILSPSLYCRVVQIITFSKFQRRENLFCVSRKTTMEMFFLAAIVCARVCSFRETKINKVSGLMLKISEDTPYIAARNKIQWGVIFYPTP